MVLEMILCYWSILCTGVSCGTEVVEGMAVLAVVNSGLLLVCTGVFCVLGLLNILGALQFYWQYHSTRNKCGTGIKPMALLSIVLYSVVV